MGIDMSTIAEVNPPSTTPILPEAAFWAALGNGYPSNMVLQNAIDASPELGPSPARKAQLQAQYNKLYLNITSRHLGTFAFKADCEAFFSNAPDLQVLAHTQVLLVFISNAVNRTRPGGRREDAQRHADAKELLEWTTRQIMWWTGMNTDLRNTSMHRDVALVWALEVAATLDEPYVAQGILDNLKGFEVSLEFFRKPLYSAVTRRSVDVMSLLMCAMYPVQDRPEQVIRWSETRLAVRALALPESDPRLQGQVDYLKAIILAYVLDRNHPGLEASQVAVRIWATLVRPVIGFLGREDSPMLLDTDIGRAITVRALDMYQHWDAASLGRLALQQAGDDLTPEVGQRILEMVEEMEQRFGFPSLPFHF